MATLFAMPLSELSESPKNPFMLSWPWATADTVTTAMSMFISINGEEGKVAKCLWRWMKRRGAIEPGIGHLKREHRMDCNRLKGGLGDRINAILSAAGMNFAKLLKWAAALLRLIFGWLFGCQKTLLLMPVD